MSVESIYKEPGNESEMSNCRAEDAGDKKPIEANEQLQLSKIAKMIYGRILRHDIKNISAAYDLLSYANAILADESIKKSSKYPLFVLASGLTEIKNPNDAKLAANILNDIVNLLDQTGVTVSNEFVFPNGDKLSVTNESGIKTLRADESELFFGEAVLTGSDVIRYDTERSIENLIRDLESDDNKVRSNAMEALAAKGADAKDAIPALIRVLEKPDDTSIGHNNAANALAKIGKECDECIEALIKLFDSDTEDSRQFAARALVAIGTRAARAVSALTKYFVNYADINALIALKSFGPNAESAVPDLLKKLKNAIKPENKTPIIQTLAEIGPNAAEAVPTLIECLTEDKFAVNQEAAKALGKMGKAAKDAIPALIEAINRNDDAVRYYALNALRFIGEECEEGVEALREMLKNHEVRTHALQNLKELGIKAKDAAPDILEIFREDYYERNRGFAAETLGIIGDASDETITALSEALSLRGSGLFIYERVVKALSDIGEKAKDIAAPAALSVLENNLYRNELYYLLFNLLSEDEFVEKIRELGPEHTQMAQENILDKLPKWKAVFTELKQHASEIKYTTEKYRQWLEEALLEDL